MMGEGGRSVKEIKLVEFQQWVGKRIPPEDVEDYNKPFSTNKNTLKSRRRRANRLKDKKDYEGYLRKMREDMRNRQ